MIKAEVKGLKNLHRFLKKADFKTKKAMNTAIRIEGFRLKKLLQKEIRSGAPGGKRFAPLSFIARRGWIRRTRKDNPLYRLAHGVRYHVKSTEPFEMEIGWVGATSKKWRWLGKVHQEGIKKKITKAQREYLAARGGRLGTVEGGRTPFFLRKSTQYFNTPARPIIDPFWGRHDAETRKNIRTNFRKKLKGKRI